VKFTFAGEKFSQALDGECILKSNPQLKQSELSLKRELIVKAYPGNPGTGKFAK